MTTSDAFDMSEFEDQLRYIGPGDTIVYLGRMTAAGWKFVGIGPIGFSYFNATGDEDRATYRRLARLLNIKL